MSAAITRHPAGSADQQTPDSNLQTPKKLQAPSSTSDLRAVGPGIWFSGLVFEIWDFPGAWDLVFGVSLSLFADVRLPKPSGLTITTDANQRAFMFWTRKSKEEHRYYLLPGMGRSNRRRHQQFLRWSIAVGLIAWAAFAYLLYLLSQSH